MQAAKAGGRKEPWKEVYAGSDKLAAIKNLKENKNKNSKKIKKTIIKKLKTLVLTSWLLLPKIKKLKNYKN